MDERRWTAPRTGWYRVDGTNEPEYLGAEQPKADHLDGRVFQADQGNVFMNSSADIASPAATSRPLDIAWDHE